MKKLLLVLLLSMAFSYNPMQEGNASNIGFSYIVTHVLEEKVKLEPLWAFLVGQGLLGLYEAVQAKPRQDDYISNLIGWGSYRFVVTIKF
jgi:hypothetical protein